MFEQAFKNIDDVLWKEAGCTTELDYTEQTSWLLFLKYLDGLEADLADQAALEGRTYAYILDEPYRWEAWASPKDAAGKLDYNAAMKRFEQDFKPVFERRERARTSKAYRLFLKATGQWTDMDAAEAINPTKGLVPDGLTPEQLAKEIQQNPEAYKHLAKAAPRVTPVAAEHRTITPKWDKDEGK